MATTRRGAKDKQTVNVPVWAGVGGIVAGGALLTFYEDSNN